MKKYVIILLLIAIINLIYGICLQSSHKPAETQKEEQITSETTTTSTTTTTTTKTTKKVVKTTHKTTHKVQVHKVNTAGKEEYINYAKQVGGYNETQMSCLINLWNRESGWNPNSVNKSSGACGIPQAYPCSKIKKQQGSNDWKAQIRWGINYVNSRYKTPCGAWNHFQKKNWY
jgi:hypothetical protein